MDYLSHRTSTHCNIVNRDVNIEISVFLSKGNLEFCATCTGIESTCQQCPLIQYNERYPSFSQKRLPSR